MEKDSKEEVKPIAKRSLTPQEQVAIDRMKQKGYSKPAAIFRAVEEANKDTVSTALDESLEHNDAVYRIQSQIVQATGSTNDIVAFQLLNAAGCALKVADCDAKTMARTMDTVTHFMGALAPQDEYEGQLVAQLVVLHEQAMWWLGRTMRTDRPDFANIYLNGASKLLTRHHETLDALLKYRRRGEQRVHVEHVHVHSGGQAIVGAITTGGGMNQKSEEGPHAKV